MTGGIMKENRTTEETSMTKYIKTTMRNVPILQKKSSKIDWKYFFMDAQFFKRISACASETDIENCN